MSYLELPPDASMLYALEIPSTGGNTYFCGMQAAFAALPAALKAKIKGRRIKHDGTFNSGGYGAQGGTAPAEPHPAPGAGDPAGGTHPAPARPAPLPGRR